ncbi:uncharacterized protein LOC144287924 isoform X2 [Canis aureus]
MSSPKRSLNRIFLCCLFSVGNKTTPKELGKQQEQFLFKVDKWLFGSLQQGRNLQRQAQSFSVNPPRSLITHPAIHKYN